MQLSCHCFQDISSTRCFIETDSRLMQASSSFQYVNHS
ncbi:hypothetical protein LINPERHAP1_LOCUS4163 [Linum perenne]